MADNNLPPDPSNYDPNSPLNRFAKEDAKTANELAQAARSLTEELKDQLGIRSRLNETQKETLNIARSLQRSAQENTVEIGNSGNIERQITKDTKIRLSITRELKDLIKEANKSGSDSIKNSDKILTYTKEIQKLEEEKVGKSKAAQELLDKQIQGFEKLLFNNKLVADKDAQRIALLKGMASVSDDLIIQRNKEAEVQKDINDKMGVTGALVKGTGALMERLGMRSGIFQDAMKESAENMREMAEETVRGTAKFSKLEIMLSGFSKLSKGFGKALFDPFTIATAILDAFFKINKQSVEISRLTGQLGSKFDTSFGSAASMVDQMEVVAELTKQTGINAQNAFSQENIAGAANLKVEMGLAANEAGNLAMMAQTSGTNVDALTDSIVATTSEFNGANRSAVSQGVILRDIGNVSEGIRASFSGNTEALVKGASAARRLGMDIKELDNIANSLLDFESSIEAELEAQLLTGKNINMNKARELALSNDLAGLGKELFDNSSSLADFGKMNRIQQEAQAKALGMTRDQLARVAYQRGLELEMTEEQAAAAAGVEASDMRRLTAQENFSKAIEKIAAALAPILDFVGNILSIPWVPQILLGALAVGKLGANFGGMFKTAAGGFTSIYGSVKKAGGLMGSVFGKFYKGGQFMPGGGRAEAGGQRAGGLVNTLKDKAKNLLKGKKDEAKDKAKDLANSSKDKLTDKTKEIADSSKATKAVKPGKNIKTFLKNLAEGLKHMASMKVLYGALNLIPASIGLVAMIPGVIGAKLMELISGPKLLLSMQSLAQGLTAMGTGKVLLGTLALLGASAAFILMIPASLGMLLLGAAAPIAAAGIYALIPALTALGTAMTTGVGALGLVALIGLAVGAGAAFALMGAGALMLGMGIKYAAEGISLIFSQFSGLVGMVPQLLSLVPALFGLAAGLVAVGVAGIIALPGLLALALGSGGLLALGGTFALIGAGAMMFGMGIKFAAEGLNSMVTQLIGLATVAPQLLLVGAGLMSIAAGLGMIAIAGIAAIPALSALSLFALVAAPLAGLAGLFGDGGDSEEDGFARVEAKLDELISVVSQGGNVYLDGDKVGMTLTKSSSGLLG